MREGALSKRFAGKIYDHLGFFFGIVGRHAVHLHRSENRVSLCPRQLSRRQVWRTSAENVSLPCLEGSAQRMLLPKTDHQEHFTREGHNDRVYSGFVCSLVKSGSVTFLRDSKSHICDFFVSTRKTCPFVSFWTPDVESNTSRFLYFFFMASGDAFSRVGLLFGSPDESAAALHIASGDVQNAFHHMGIPEWLRPCSCLRPLSARAFGMMGKIVQGSRVSAEQKVVSCASDAANGVFPGACSFVSTSLSSRRIVRISSEPASCQWCTNLLRSTGCHAEFRENL